MRDDARNGTAGTSHMDGEDGDPVDHERVGIPGWLPWSLFGVVTLILFRVFVVSDQMLYGSDTLSLGYVARDFLARSLESGTFPLWNPFILGGTPFIASLAGGDSLYPPSLALLMAMETHRALGWKLVLHVFLAGGFMYGWLRFLDRSRAASLVGGLAYLVAPFLVTLVYPGHDGKIFVTALAPLLFWILEWAFRSRSLLPWTAFSAGVGLVILTTHFQMAYFLFGALGLYAAFRTVQMARSDEDRAREPSAEMPAGPAKSPVRVAAGRFALFLGASILGAALAAVQLVPAVDYVLESSRRTATTVQADAAGSVAYASSWSLHPEEVASLVVPEFVGNTAGGAGWADGTYWGRNPFKLNHEYGGLIVLLLAGVALLRLDRLRRRERGLLWFLAGLGLLSLAYSMGTHTPVWRIFYEVVPGVSLFRAPSMAVFLFGFAAVTLAAFGVDALLGRAGAEAGDRRVSRFLVGFTGALLLGTVLAASGVLQELWTAVLYRGISPASSESLANAAPFITRGFFVATLLAAAVTGLHWAHRRGRLPAAGLVAVLAVLVGFDGARIDDPFIQPFDVRSLTQPTSNIRFLQERMAEEPPFRVLSMAQGGQDVTPALHGLELAAGHHPNDLAAYRELIGMVGSGAPENLLSNQNIMEVLNVRYLLWPDVQFGPLEGLPRVNEIAGPGGQILQSVYALPGLPRARLVARARVVRGSRAVSTILDPGFDAANEVVVAEEPPVELSGADLAGTGAVEWLERGVNRSVIRVESPEPALLVVSDNWYPGWKATVDGDEAPVLRANHTLRAVPVPAGSHRVEMVYDSDLLDRSALASAATLLLLAGLAGGSRLRRRGDRRREGRAPGEGGAEREGGTEREGAP